MAPGSGSMMRLTAKAAAGATAGTWAAAPRRPRGLKRLSSAASSSASRSLVVRGPVKREANEYRTGTRTRVSKVLVKRPPMTTIASGPLMNAPPIPPPPPRTASGRRASMVANAVIRIGRNRCRPPSMRASCTLRPRSRYCSTRSSKTIALVTTIPVSIRMPINPGRDSDVLVTTRATMAPVAANGIETRSTSGLSSERKVATMIR